MNAQLAEKFIIQLSELPEICPESFFDLQRRFSKAEKTGFQQKDELFRVYQKMVKNDIVAANPSIEKVIQIKNVRSASGIAVVSVLTKPYPCPGNCLYCPTEKDVPKSYLSNEPAVMRAIANGYHPYCQTWSRLKALRDTGHITDKISIRIIGGSFSSYPKAYRSWFIRELFRACNEFGGSSSKNLSMNNLQDINENAKARIVELSVETRQDQIDIREILLLRKYGVTKVEVGVQSLDEEILRLNRRGHGLRATVEATTLLKAYGFKVSYQMMVNLYGSDIKTDLLVFEKLFQDSRFRPDHLKIYPLALVRNSDLFEFYERGLFKPYSEAQLINLLVQIKQHVPEYCRIERIIRDIPAGDIVEGGAQISNLRQKVELAMAASPCRCIRCSEIKTDVLVGEPVLKVLSYDASEGKEYFISVRAEDDKLLGFCRLRFDNLPKGLDVLNNAAIVREIHVYGPTVSVGNNNAAAHQHQGWGKKMMAMAEEISSRNGVKKITVIAGVGVRGYFKKLGYRLESSYMTKKIS